MSTKMNTKISIFSYINTGTLHWGNPNLLNNSKMRRGAVLSTSSSHLPFLPLIPCPLTCSQPRALPPGWHQLSSAPAYPTLRWSLSTQSSSAAHPLLAPGIPARWHPLLPAVPLISSPLKPSAPGPKAGASAPQPSTLARPSPTLSREDWVSEW